MHDNYHNPYQGGTRPPHVEEPRSLSSSSSSSGDEYHQDWPQQPWGSQPLNQQWSQQQWAQQQWFYQSNSYDQWGYTGNPYRNTPCPYYATTGQPLVYFAAANHPPPCNPAPCHPAPCNPAPCHPAPCNPAPCNPAPCNPAPCHPAPCSQVPYNQVPYNQAPGNQAPGNQAPGNQAPGNQAPVNQAPYKKKTKKRYLKCKKPDLTCRKICHSNCFAKAFQWYTQDHVPVAPKPELQDFHKEFANWLDNKYQQYLREKHPEGNTSTNINSETSTKASDSTQLVSGVMHNPCCSCPSKASKKETKKRKRRKSSSHMQGGDTTPCCDCKKTKESMEYILAPKDLSRPLSECAPCSETPASSYCCANKTSIKGHSSATVGACQGKETVTHFGTNTIIQEDPVTLSLTGKQSNTKPCTNQSCQCSKSEVKTEVQFNAQSQTQYEPSNVTWLESPRSAYCYNSCPMTPNASGKTCRIPSRPSSEAKCNPQCSKESSSVRPNNITCECPTESIANTSTQCVQECCLHCNCLTCFRDGVITCQNKDCPSKKSEYPITQENVAKTSSRSLKAPASRKCCVSCPNSNKSVPARSTTIACQQCCSNQAYAVCGADAQTTDLAIPLDERHYPLFMRIVCADKLCDELKCRMN